MVGHQNAQNVGFRARRTRLADDPWRLCPHDLLGCYFAGKGRVWERSRGAETDNISNKK